MFFEFVCDGFVAFIFNAHGFIPFEIVVINGFVDFSLNLFGRKIIDFFGGKKFVKRSNYLARSYRYVPLSIGHIAALNVDAINWHPHVFDKFSRTYHARLIRSGNARLSFGKKRYVSTVFDYLFKLFYRVHVSREVALRYNVHYIEYKVQVFTKKLTVHSHKIQFYGVKRRNNVDIIASRRMIGNDYKLLFDIFYADVIDDFNVHRAF